MGARLRWFLVGRRPRGWAAVSVALGGSILAAVLGLGLHVNLSPMAPRGVYRAVAGTPARGAWIAACVSPEATALARVRGYLGPGSCAGGVQPLLKPVAAVAGDVVDLGRGRGHNGHRLARSLSADMNSAGRALPRPVCGRYVVAPGELWL